VLSTEEKIRISYHLGYPLLGQANSLAAGVPMPTDFHTLLQQAFRILLPDAEPIIRTLLARCDQKERAIDGATARMEAAEVGDIKLRDDETDALRREYMFWVGQMSDALQAPIAPFSQRNLWKPRQSGPNVGMIGVVH
jgi:hypothetical protein